MNYLKTLWDIICYVGAFLWGIIICLWLLTSIGRAEVELPCELYFWLAPQVAEEQYTVKEVVGEKEVEVSEYDDLGNLTGSHKETVPVYEDKVETRQTTKIADETPLNWVRVGEYNGTPIISVLINTNEDLAMAKRLSWNAKCLGSPKELIAATSTDSQKAAIAKHCLYTLIEKTDGEGQKYMARVTQAEWEALGKPKRFDKFRPYTEWFLTSQPENKVELDKEISAAILEPR